ncbi:D-alanyl-D-alanine carboxypeptidase [Streptomyces sp. H27-H1]|uniref:D-alanyl-D-alanine carboxypeptidase family protein n=1 Tax=Streptomyces sp. H27-H1 TaxID=2996461 RepID=UPI002271BD3B|nr:D-alanyl-D-alanine carboxypeptidase [Streptomyces sp. H27-H1]MCY0926693.1 D-alanyl-D-alanine carboxypeptidase [Streptomyces sp. H27-H1]
MGCGDWHPIQNGTSKAVYGMTAVPVEGEKPRAAKDGDPARKPGARDAQASEPASASTSEPASASGSASELGLRSDTPAPTVPGPRTGQDADAAAEQVAASDPESVPGAEVVPVPVPAPGSEAVERESGPEPQILPEAAVRDVAVPRQEAKPEAEPEPEPGLPAGPKSVPELDRATADGPGTGTRTRTRTRPESDCERTSTFIALKPLDDAPSASAPTPVRVPAWASAPPPASAPAPVPVRPSPAEPKAAYAPASGSWPIPASASALASAPASASAPRTVPAPEAAPAPEGTAEQPLPALDLLAQLTNTPPPSATPGRTVARRFRIWVPPLLLLVAVLAVVQALRPLPDAALTSGNAASAVTLDGRFDVPWPEKGQAAVRVGGAGDVGTFGEQKPVPTASVAKVMTAYVILKGHPLKKDEAGPRIEVDAKAVADGTSESESRIEGLTAGTRFSQQEMLKMLMIPSGNNIARLLARWDTGSASEAAFVEKMNAEAQALGMTSTTYTDPSGLDAKTVSTAVDQLKLAEEVMKLDAFRGIVQMAGATVPGLPKQLINNNGSLLVSKLSIRGIKTGSSSAAGGALMWAAYKTVGDKTPLLLGTMLDQHVTGSDPSGSNSLILVKDNSKKIIEAVRAALTSAVAVKKGQVVGYVDDGLGTRTPVVATRDTAVVALPGQRIELSLAVGEKGLPAQARAGTEIGVLTIGTGPGAQTAPVAVQKDLSEPSLGAKLVRLP